MVREIEESAWRRWGTSTLDTFSTDMDCGSSMQHTSSAHSENEYEGKDMKRRVVVAAIAFCPARRTLILLPAEQLGAQQMRRDVYPLQA